MRILPFIVLLIILAGQTFAQSPHGSSLKYDCSDCHEETTWKVIPKNIKFDHDKTQFKLTGEHKTVECRSCHASLIFSKAQTNCSSCHKDIHQNTVGFDCENCHTTKTWIVPNINEIHRRSRFPLVGVHMSVDCSSCHSGYSNLTFQVQGVDCYSCHKNDFINAKNPNHVQAGFSNDCLQCHNINSITWASANFNHDFFPLTGGHKLGTCFSCHKQGSNFKGLSTDCYSCHKIDYQGAKNPNHVQSNLPTDCKTCHSINSWIPSTFNHSLTGFVLTGSHTTLDCSACHKGTFTGLSSDCYSCHQAQYNSAENHVAQNYPKTCEMCHSTTTWSNSTFNHSTTIFPLTGAHTTVTCSSCHQTGFAGTTTICYDCHKSNYQSSTNPSHTALALPTDCQTCHTTNPTWQPAQFPAHDTYFQLTGGHAHVKDNCETCHKGNYNNISSDCYSCHQNDYQGAKSPDHVLNKFSTDCKTCHNVNAWIPSTFDHSTTGFVLTGSHTTLDCSACHKGTFTGLSSDCYSCHQVQYNSAENHVAQNYPKTCEMCHSTTTWSNSTFNHSTTIFPLTGAHTTVTCSSCHKTGFAGTTTICYDCHKTNYQATTNPSHTALALPTDCQTCHTTNPTWQPAQFPAHDTYFQLTGGHAQVKDNCETCHKGNYNNISSDCYSCHQNDYQGAKSPDHVLNKFSTDCKTCHNVNAWIPSTFDHSLTGFVLTGSHTTLDCSACHKGTYTGLSSDCYSCHQAQYNSAENHVAQNYPKTCEMCHSTTTWSNSTFNHSTTIFPLTGAHTTVACSSCHQTGFAGTTTICYDCHKSNYQSSTNPSHTALALPTDCQTCHTTNPTWQPAQFPIHANYFAFVGAHVSIKDNCAACHNGNYNNTPNTCYGCHQSNYNATTNPAHKTAGFPTDCSACHTQTAWQPSTFDHDGKYFPIYSGTHNGRWSLCSDCHDNPSNFQSFSCINCHEHEKTSTDSQHRGVANYVYQSSSCYSCHPTGRAEGGG